jgi:hypothetical protein
MPPIEQNGNVLLPAATPIHDLHGEAYPQLRLELLQQRSHSEPFCDLKAPLADQLAKSEMPLDAYDPVPAANLEVTFPSTCGACYAAGQR